MTTIAVVQARMGSTRLPGKVLMDLGGRPVLALLHARLLPLLEHGILEQLVIATSQKPDDDAVAELAKRLDAPVVRGDEADVLSRFATTLAAFPADTVIRLTADCPLSDPAIVAEALQHHREMAADYTSNTLVRTYPDGLDVEVIDAEVLMRAAAEAQDPTEREHVTPFVYRRPERFSLAAIRAPEDHGDLRWTLDTAADLAWLRTTVTALEDPTTAPWTGVLAASAPIPETSDRLVSITHQTAARVPSASSSPGDWRLGDEGAADPGPVVDDPGDRCWAFVHDGAPVAWAGVSVVAGVGTLRGVGPPAWHPTMRALVRQRLAGDPQVRRLIDRPISE